jgi:hypothetical protein
MVARLRHHETGAMRYFLALITALSVAACGGDGATGPPASVPGTWTLARVNGSRLPVTVTEPGSASTSEIVSGSLTFGADGVCTLELLFRYTNAGVVTSRTTVIPGTYVVESPEIVKLHMGLITQAPAYIDVPTAAVTATISGNSLSYANGPTFVFLKR